MITIHCGLHKTGSSSIQLALEMCSSKRRLIVIPRPGDDRTEAGWARRLNSLNRAPDAIMSDESLLGSPYDGYQLAPERVAMLREQLSMSQYQIVVYLRPHVDWLPSVYLQGVQEGRTLGPEEFWSSIKEEPHLRWGNLMSFLHRESGAERVIARAHTRSRDAVTDFFALVGLGKPPRTGRTMIRENVSIAAVQAPLLRELNSLAGMTDEQRNRFRTVFQRDLARGADKGYSPFPSAIQSDIATQFRTDWLEVAPGLLMDDEATVFRAESLRYSDPQAPYAGGSLDDPRIGAEALRSLKVLSLKQQRTQASVTTRIIDKLRDDPLGAPAAAFRRMRRWS